MAHEDPTTTDRATAHLGPVDVVKVGGSVLRSPADTALVASEAYARARNGVKTVAVVSAIFGQTDVLLNEARTLAAGADVADIARLAALGEQRAAALAAIACDRVGLSVCVRDAAELDLRAEGDQETADPVSIDRAALARAIETHDVVIVPGFAALDLEGAPILLGRGGSDLSAVFLAQACGRSSVRLIKDVDGVYDRDPARDAEAQRFDAMSWDQALAVAGAVVQARAVRYAKITNIALDVAEAGATNATRVAALPHAPRSPERPRPLKIAVAGYGAVGGGVCAHILDRPKHLELTHVVVRNPARRREGPAAPSLFTSDLDQVFADRPDVVVDVVSSGPFGHALTQRALENGVSVVSANKQAIIADLPELQQTAARTGARLAYSAAVGGGAPIIEAVNQAKSLGAIVKIEAILNGTCTFILSRLAEGADFDTALAEARSAGFAEEDPTADLDGLDAAAKIRILAHHALGAAPDAEAVTCDPFDAAARARIVAEGGQWAQIAELTHKNGAATATVRLKRVDDDQLFSTVKRERNAARITLDDGRVFTVRGRGAGRWPTAEAVLADLMDLVNAAAPVDARQAVIA